MAQSKKYSLFGEELPFGAREVISLLYMKYGNTQYVWSHAGKIANRYSEMIIDAAIERMPDEEPTHALPYLEKTIQGLITRNKTGIDPVSNKNKAVSDKLGNLLTDLE